MPIAPFVIAAATAAGYTAAIGSAIAGALGAATISSAAAVAIGTGAISGGIAIAGGKKASDVLKAAVVGGATSFIGANIAQSISNDVFFQAISNDVSGTTALVLGESIGQGIGGAVQGGLMAAAYGGDPLDAILKGGLTAGLTGGARAYLDRALVDVPGFGNTEDPLELAAQRAVKSAMAAGLTGGDVGASVEQSLIASAGSALGKYLKENVYDASAPVKSSAKELTDAYNELSTNVSEQQFYVDQYNEIADVIRPYQEAAQQSADQFNTIREVFNIVTEGNPDGPINRELWASSQIQSLMAKQGYTFVPTPSSTVHSGYYEAPKTLSMAAAMGIPGFDSDWSGPLGSATIAPYHFSQTLVDKYNEFQTKNTEFTNFYNSYKPQLDELTGSLDKLKTDYTKLESKFTDVSAKFQDNFKKFQTQELANAAEAAEAARRIVEVKDLYKQATGKDATDDIIMQYLPEPHYVGERLPGYEDKTTIDRLVQEINARKDNPNFNAAIYREMYGADGDTPALDYLQKGGSAAGLIASDEDLQREYTQQENRLLDQIAKVSGLDNASQMSPESRRLAQERISDEFRLNVEGLKGLQNVNVDSWSDISNLGIKKDDITRVPDTNVITKEDISNEIKELPLPSELSDKDVSEIVSDVIKDSPVIDVENIKDLVSDAVSSLPENPTTEDFQSAVEEAIRPPAVEPENVEQELTDRVDQYEEEGLAEEEAVDAALNELSDDLNLTNEELLDLIFKEEPPVEEPVAELPVEEPVAELPVEEPVAELPVEEPVAELPVEEPPVEEPVAEPPVEELPVEEPVAELPVEELPFEEPPVEEPPVEELPVEEPVAELPVEEPPVEEPPVEEPPVEELPVEELPVEEPVAELPVEDLPVEELPFEEPPVEEPPVEEPPVEEPVAELPVEELPVEEPVAELPVEELPVEEPVADPKQGLIDLIDQYEQAGLARDQALDAALDDLSGQLGTTREELLDYLGETRESLSQEFGEALTGTKQELSDLIDQYEQAGLARDEAFDVALDDLSDQLGATREDLLGQLGQTRESLTEEFGEALTGTKQELSDLIGQYEEAGLARDEAFDVALDDLSDQLGTTREELLDQLGQTSESLTEEFGEALTGTKQELTDLIDQYEEAGLARDEALDSALDDLSGQLGTTREELLDQLGQTRESLAEEFGAQIIGVQEQLGDVESAILDRVNQYEEAGVERDQALEYAIQDIAEQLNVSVLDLQDQLFGAQELTEEGQRRLQEELRTIQDILGRPSEEVTEEDIFAINEILNREPTEFTPEELLYDFNNDGKIDAKDLEEAKAPGAVLKPTGIYAHIVRAQKQNQQAQQQTQQQTQQQFEQFQQQQNQQAQQAQQAQQQAQQQLQQQNQANFLFSLLSQAPDVRGQQVEAKAPELAKIGYAYDWSSIFANPQQEKMFMTPYARGGRVRTLADEINEIFGR